MIVFDKSNPKSFVHIDSWLSEVNRYAHESCVKILVGNKCDLPSNIEQNTAQMKATQLGMSYIETSAKNAFQVDDAFMQLAKEVIQRKRRSNSYSHLPIIPSVNISTRKVRRNSCCFS